MKIFMFISECIIPFLIFYIVLYSVMNRVNVYDAFVEGAKDGMKTVVNIVPTLIGLMMAVGILRTSGFLDFAAKIISPMAQKAGVPSQLISVAIIKMFSSSAATGLALDIFKEYGTDSFVGVAVSVMLSCTETIFYTMSLYFIEIKVAKIRWTLSGALLATAAGIIASVILAGITIL